MNSSPPTFLPRNFGWKLLSITLAILIWFAIKFGTRPEFPSSTDPSVLTTTREFTRLPITVMTMASDSRHFKVAPNEVTVTVRGEPRLLKTLQRSDIDAYVNLVDIKDARGLRKRIQISTPPGIVSTLMIPSDVVVERVESPAPATK